MARSIARYERLSTDMVVLQGQGPFMRAYHAARFTDTEIAKAAWRAYEPAMPLNFAGLIFAATGFVLGAGLSGMLLGMLRAPFRRRQA
jgi:hypothetical protein